MFAAVVLAVIAPSPNLLDIKGAFLEGCSCKGTCAFETTGKLPGCHALGAYRIDRGSYGSRDLAGTSLAFVSAPSGDLFVYVDGPTSSKRKSAGVLAKALWGEGFGKWNTMRDAKISLTGSGGSHSLLIDGGATVSLSTSPVKGGDAKGFVVLSNVYGDPYDKLFQATIKGASFSDKGQKFTLKGTSAFFIDPLVVLKKL